MKSVIILGCLLFSGSCAADTKFNIDGYVYQVPDKYRPIVNGNVFTFYLDFPVFELSLKKVGPTPDNDLRIRVEHKNLRASYTTKYTRHDGSFINKTYGFDVYKEHIGKNSRTEVTTYLSRIDSNPIVISQAGDLNMRVYRSAGKNRELDYVYSKQITIQEWSQLDKYIMNTLELFTR